MVNNARSDLNSSNELIKFMLNLLSSQVNQLLSKWSKGIVQPWQPLNHQLLEACKVYTRKNHAMRLSSLMFFSRHVLLTTRDSHNRTRWDFFFELSWCFLCS